MTLNSNQFLQSVEVGFCDRNTCCFNPIPVVVAASQATAIGVGVAVSLATNTVNTVPKIVAASGAPATGIFGFTFIHAHKNAFAANDRTDVLPLGSGAIIYLKAGSSFSAGAKLAYNASGYAQFNAATKISFAVAANATVTIISYTGQYKYTVNGVAATKDSDYRSVATLSDGAYVIAQYSINV